MVVKFPSNYVRGRAKEYQTIYTLKKQGALWAQRSYGSHGIFDVFALFPDKSVYIQVKSGKKKAVISEEELKTLKDFAHKIKASNIHIEIWLYHGRRKAKVKRLK